MLSRPGLQRAHETNTTSKKSFRGVSYNLKSERFSTRFKRSFFFNSKMCLQIIGLKLNPKTATSLSGDYLRPYVGGSKLKAVVFLGAVLPYSSKLEDFPVPLLTLVAELDGYTRITRSMGEFTKLENDMLVSPESLYRTPVILLKGSNHGQFASGKMPERIIDTDLKTDLTEDEAHRMIGKRVNSFLTATFSSSPSIVDTARADIKEAFYEAMEKLQPFFTLRAFELDNLPNWMRMNQEYVAGEFADQIQVHTEVKKNPWFFFSKPSISRGDEDQVVVETKALVDYGRDYNSEVTSVKRSAVEIDMKLKTKDAIWEALSNHDDGPHTSLRSEPMTCKALNEFAWQVAMNYSTQEARDRYRKHRHVIFWEDVIGDNAALWATWSLSYWENGDFNVRGVSLITDLENESNPGVFYCKALSPFRALEWINVDSLKQKWWHF